LANWTAVVVTLDLVTSEVNELGQPVGVSVPGWQSAAVPDAAVMTGRFCRVEPLDPSAHASSLFEANGHDVVGANWTYLPYGPFADLKSYRNWVDDVASRSDPMFFAVVDQETQRALGVASYLRIDASAGSIEVGHINFSPLLQRRRAGTEAMYLMMSRVFDELGYRRYEWKCNDLNAPSKTAATRLGFAYEGTFRQSSVVKGRNRDTAWFAVIDQGWPAIKEAFEKWLDPGNFDGDGIQRTPLRARQELAGSAR